MTNTPTIGDATPAVRFMIERRTLPADAGFSCEYWVRDVVWAEPSEQQLPPELRGAVQGMGFPGDVWARVVVSAKGEMEVYQACEPWMFDSVDALSDFGTTLLECRTRASHDILNFAGPKALVTPT